MSGDRIIFNTLERALSGDVNDAEAILSRTLGDLFGLLSSERGIFVEGGGYGDTEPRSATMGLSFRVGGDLQSVDVASGALLQHSTTWPAAPGALDSNMRIGISRSTVNVPVPATPSTAMILEARVVDVVTVTAVRDVFDVPTQVFIPGPLPKRNERRIAFQVVQGVGVVYPVWTGNPWVPICAFVTDAGGQLIALPTPSLTLDLRQDLKDVLSDQQNSIGAAIEVANGIVECSEAWTSDGAGFFGQVIGGAFVGRLGRHRPWLRSQSGMLVTADATVTGTQNDREWIYLAPLVANGITIFPVVNGLLDSGVSKGVLVRSLAVGPAEAGPHNISNITWSPASIYANFDLIPIRMALLVNQCHVVPPSYAAGGYQPWTMTRGGKTLLRRKFTAPQSADLFDLATFVGNLNPSQVVALDLRDKVPRNARSALLEVSFAITVGQANHLAYALLYRDGTPITDPTWRSDALLGDVPIDSRVFYVEVPVKTSLANGSREGQKWEFSLIRGAGANPLAVSFAVGLMGWSF